VLSDAWWPLSCLQFFVFQNIVAEAAAGLAGAVFLLQPLRVLPNAFRMRDLIRISHERWGEVSEAFVVLRSDASVSQAELRDYAREALAHFKVPSTQFIEKLPKTA
jgi:acyl-CoA synthetase (AMP-forming)/AMP-acid ligase II